MLNLGDFVANNYIYPIEDGYVLVDTGYPNGYKKFVKRLDKNGITLSQIKYVFITHTHDDHLGFLKELLDAAPHIKVIASANAKDGLMRGYNSLEEGGPTVFLSVAFCKIAMAFKAYNLGFKPLTDAYEDRIIYVTDDNREELGTLLNGEIIETPGHLKDSICLLLDNGNMICGDAAMNLFPSKHKIPVWAQDMDEFAKSWEKIIALQPRKLYVGHGKPFDVSELEKNLQYVKKVKITSLLKKERI